MKRKKHKPMPRWIWQLPHKVLNYKLKHLLAYFWWCGDRGCQRWNYAIAKRFKVSNRTVRRWIKALEDRHLIYINFPMKTTRTIYRRPYYSRLVWWQKSGQIKDLTKNPQKTSQSNHSRPKVAYISNAQRTYTYKTSISTPFLEGNGVERHHTTPFLPSNAGGLGCSVWARAKLRQLTSRASSIPAQPALPESEKVNENRPTGCT